MFGLNRYFNLVGRVWRERRGWLPRLLRQHALFLGTRFFRLIFPWPAGICLDANVRVQWPTSLLVEGQKSLIEVGRDSIIYENAMIEAYGEGQISIGASSVIGDNRIYSRKRISIGQRVVTSWNILIQDFDPHPVDPDQRRLQMENLTHHFRPRFGESSVSGRERRAFVFDFPSEEIVIGDDCWLGANTTILKGARIGAGSVVAAGSVVTRGDYPPRSILAGQPARVLKTIPFAEEKGSEAPGT